MDSESQIGRARRLDGETLRRELLGYHSMWEDLPMRARLVPGAVPPTSRRNDAIQLGAGWLGLETSVNEEMCEEAPLRRLHTGWMKERGYAKMYLCGLSDATRLVMRMRPIGEPATVELRLVGPDGDCLLDGRMVRIPTGRWTDESVSLSRAAREGEHLELVLESPDAIALAVRRVWLDE